MSPSYFTRNDLPAEVRDRVIELLQPRVATAVHLALHAKMAHWNVKGAHFKPLHDLFDEVYTAAGEWTDALAERAIQLGAHVDVNLPRVLDRSALGEYAPASAMDADHVEALSASLATWAASVRRGIEEAERAGDADTADLFTEISREADKLLWMVEAHGYRHR